MNVGAKTSTKYLHIGTWYLVRRIIYLVLLDVRKKAQRSMKQNRIAGQGTARHRTELRCCEINTAVG